MFAHLIYYFEENHHEHSQSEWKQLERWLWNVYWRNGTLGQIVYRIRSRSLGKMWSNDSRKKTITFKNHDRTESSIYVRLFRLTKKLKSTILALSISRTIFKENKWFFKVKYLLLKNSITQNDDLNIELKMLKHIMFWFNLNLSVNIMKKYTPKDICN